MSIKTHQCSAPICFNENITKQSPMWQRDWIWYPGEDICLLGQISEERLKIKDKQYAINDLYKKQLIDPDRYFTASTLRRIRKITPRTQGQSNN